MFSLGNSTDKPEGVEAPEGVTENPIGLNSVAGGDGSYIPYRGDKLDEPLTWEGHEDYREIHDQLQADIKAAEEKGQITPEEADALAKRVANYNAQIRSIQNAPLNDVPALIEQAEKAQGKVNDYSNKGMPKTWIGAYLSGEFGDPKSKDAKRTLAYFALNALGTALMNSSAVIQKRATTDTAWNKAQGTRLEQAYTRYDKAKTKAFENNLDSIAKAMNIGVIAAPTIAWVKATSGASRISYKTAMHAPLIPVKIAALSRSSCDNAIMALKTAIIIITYSII